MKCIFEIETLIGLTFNKIVIQERIKFHGSSEAQLLQMFYTKINFIQRLKNISMQSTFTKEISSYCRLDFSNQIARQPKALFYPSNIPQKPINFRKTNEKKSLKHLNADCITYQRKNLSIQRPQIKKQSLKKYNKSRIGENYLSNQKPDIRIQFRNQCLKRCFGQNPGIIKSHQSLQKQVRGREQPKRNMIQELRSYKGTRKTEIFKKEQIQASELSKQTIRKPSKNFIKGNVCFQPNFGMSEQKINNYDIFPKPKVGKSQQEIFHSQSMRSVSRIELPAPKCVEIKKFISKNQVFKGENLNSQYLQLRNLEESRAVNYFAERRDNVQKFRQKFGQIQLEDQIKQDLVGSKYFHQDSFGINRGNMIKNSISKPFESESSTIIPQEEKLKRVSSEGFFTQLRNIKRNQSYQFTQQDTQNEISQFNDQRNQQGKFRTKKKRSFPHNSNPQFEEQYSFEMMNSLQFRNRLRQTQSFKSIISVMSEAGSSVRSIDSIIINNHPHDVIRTKPIRTLF